MIEDASGDMILCRQSDAIEVRRVQLRGRGSRGVFARRAILAGSVIECAPVLLIPRAQVFGDPAEARGNASISWYVFDWHGVTRREYVALALGYCSLYNHSFTPNARYVKHAPDLLEIQALIDIPAGGEILINYNGEPDDMRPMLFNLE